MEIYMEKRVKDRVLRYERKFIFQHFQDNFITSFIKENSLGFQKIYNDQRVNSVYLDTTSFSSFNQNIDGCNRRTKVRVRFYGDYTEKQAINLELKKKKGMTGWKEIYPINKSNNIEIKFDRIYREALNSGLPIEKFWYLQNLIPTLFCTYIREYYQSQCKNYRITIDRNIKFSSFIGFSKIADVVNSLKSYDNYILEIKYPLIFDNQQEDIPYKIPIRLTKSSKYVLGLYQVGLTTNI